MKIAPSTPELAAGTINNGASGNAMAVVSRRLPGIGCLSNQARRVNADMPSEPHDRVARGKWRNGVHDTTADAPNGSSDGSPDFRRRRSHPDRSACHRARTQELQASDSEFPDEYHDRDNWLDALDDLLSGRAIAVASLDGLIAPSMLGPIPYRNTVTPLDAGHAVRPTEVEVVDGITVDIVVIIRTATRYWVL